MHWLFFMAVTVVFWGFYDILYSKIPLLFPPFFAMLVVALVQIVLIIFAFFLFEKSVPKNNLNNIWILILMAVLLSAGNIAFYFAFKNNASISIGIPMSTIGVALMGVVWGVAVAKEPLTAKLVIGFLLSSLGIFLMSYKA